ncbi:uncharacterized protein LOC143451738 [Clavelina lepadiformis]|uniref:uncharacterized protein LOC143451738 n=1 Tax=Clavelina lepadiformis TaxID=159417 RepID=UPI0040427B27
MTSSLGSLASCSMERGYCLTGNQFPYLTSGSPYITGESVPHVRKAAMASTFTATTTTLSIATSNVKVGPALKACYKTRFAQSSGSYSAEGSNFCITNFRQRFNECYNPLVWIGCFPCMLLCGPPYCIYRAMNSNDFDCPIRAMVTYIEGVNQAERQQLAQMLVRAYVDGMNAVSNVQPPVPPPYTEQPAPPPYFPSV